MAQRAWSFAVVRFVLGSGEAAAFPVCNKTAGYWLGQIERAFGTSIFLAGVGVTGTIGPVLINWVAKHGGWRMSFVICGVLGVVVSAAWYAYVRKSTRGASRSRCGRAGLDSPPGGEGGKPGTNEEGAHYGAAGGKILKSRLVRGRMFNFCFVYAVNIFFTWFFIYLVRVRGLAASRASMWISVPFFASIFMIPFWGWLADHGSEKFGKRLGRQYALWLGAGFSAFCLVMGAHTANITLAALRLAAAAAFNLAASSGPLAVTSHESLRVRYRAL
jgi:ACS family glucarate transporter-like MFS transporter